jgi:hypothetical protein
MLMQAVISDDGKYRYWLSRTWGGDDKVIAFIGLNPSTADAKQNDPTVLKCIRFAKNWGATKLVMVNLFAYRSSSPKDLRQIVNPVGADNDAWILRAVEEADIVVAAWGNNGSYLGRAAEVAKRFQGRLQALRITKHGMPGHPLYIPADAKLVGFNGKKSLSLKNTIKPI